MNSAGLLSSRLERLQRQSLNGSEMFGIGAAKRELVFDGSGGDEGIGEHQAVA